MLSKVEALGNVVSVTPNYPDSYNMLFPFVEKGWTKDIYGPIWIPCKGATVELDADNIDFYRRIIDVYEDNDFEEQEGKYFIKGEEITTYTFKQYY